jgi:hypothetical protein
MSNLLNSVVVVLSAVVGLAALSVFLSKSSNTVGVIQAGGSAFSSILGAAVAPVTGGGIGTLPSLNLSGANNITY